MIQVEAITEIDLQAYLDDELPARRRMEVEAYLCHHPADAARVRVGLQTRDDLRLAFADILRPPRGTTVDAARRLERGLLRDRIIRRVRRVVAVAVLIGLGWFAHAEVGLLQQGLGQRKALSGAGIETICRYVTTSSVV